MASNGEIESEDTEISENNGEKVVTMMDVLQEQEDFEEDANAVLGASDDKNCTYALGYIKRQAIYACMTCCTEAKDDPTKRAGVCLACSLTCHENHELIELYTKRNFRCDCGNPKFNSHPCQFTPNKTDLNEENSYNQNFSGVYCVCHRPYPDPEATEEDEMIQCIICEDWLHASHLEATVPTAQYAEMICKGCMQKNEFLCDYSDLTLNVENDYVDVVSLNTSTEINGIKEDSKNDKDSKVIAQSVSDAEMPKKIFNENKVNADIIEAKTLAKKADSQEEKEANVTNDNLSTPIVTNDQTETNTTMDTDNTEPTTTKALDETQIYDNGDALSESKITSDNLILENQNPIAENIDSHMNALKEVVDSSEGRYIKISDEVKNKGSIDHVETVTVAKLSDLEVSKDIETEISNNTNNENANFEESSSAVTDSSAAEKLKTTLNYNTITEEDNQTKKESNVENVLDSSKQISEKELEKMKEDKLPEDSDDCKQRKETDSNNESQVNESTKEVSDSNSEDKSNEELNSEKLAPDLLKKIEQDKSSSEQSDETVNKSSDITTSDNNNPNISENDNVPDSKMEVSSEVTNCIEEVTEEASDKAEMKRKLSCESPDSEAKKRKVVECKRPKDNRRQCKGATFWPSHFRQKLCTCSECLSMYKDLSVMFLLDPEDTVTAYENLGKEKTNGKPQSQYEKGLQALSSLDRIQQINVLTEYNKMRDKFLDFLKSFKDRRKIVTEDDVKAFFAGMKPTKRPDGVYFCR